MATSARYRSMGISVSSEIWRFSGVTATSTTERPEIKKMHNISTYIDAEFAQRIHQSSLAVVRIGAWRYNWTRTLRFPAALATQMAERPGPQASRLHKLRNACAELETNCHWYRFGDEKRAGQVSRDRLLRILVDGVECQLLTAQEEEVLAKFFDSQLRNCLKTIPQ